MLIKVILLMLIAIGSWALSFLPVHTPATDVYPTGLFGMITGLVAVNEFVNVPALIAFLGVIAVFETGVVIYATYRYLLGLIPMFK